jgi:hypothetical protein
VCFSRQCETRIIDARTDPDVIAARVYRDGRFDILSAGLLFVQLFTVCLALKNNRRRAGRGCSSAWNVEKRSFVQVAVHLEATQFTDRKPHLPTIETSPLCAFFAFDEATRLIRIRQQATHRRRSRLCFTVVAGPYCG